MLYTNNNNAFPFLTAAYLVHSVRFAGTAPLTPSLTPSYTPSSIVTFLHHGFSPFSANISSASPTCLLSLTSLLICPLSLSRIAFKAKKLFPFVPNLWLLLRASPWDGAGPERISSDETQPPSLVTGSCYWSGSEDEERRLRCR